MNKRYDIITAYRIYPEISKQPFLFSSDKLGLTELCLKSFKQALGNLKTKTFFLLDGCPGEYKKMISRIFFKENYEIREFNQIGNRASFKTQVEILTNQKESDVLYFAEDDYLYKKNSLKKSVAFLMSNPEADFLTLYDSPDYYTMKFHDHEEKITIFKNFHWLQAKTTCLTFMAKAKSFKSARNVFMSYGKKNHDVTLWSSLTKTGSFNPVLPVKYFISREPLAYKIWLYTWYSGWRQLLCGKKYKLYSPQPSLATHVESTGKSPCVNWEKIAQKYYKNV